jgi:hypothetical protein
MRRGLGLAVVVAVACARGAGAADVDVCALLTPAEITAAVGVKVPAGMPGAQPLPAMAESLKGVTRSSCSWTVGDQGDAKTMGNVFLSLVRLTAEQAGAGIAFRRANEEYSRSIGFEPKEIALGGATCVAMKAPVSTMNFGPATGCSIETKGMVVALDASGLGLKTTPEAIKAALDKAVARLP